MEVRQRPSAREAETFYRTVAVVDMVGYSTLALMLEQNMGSGAVADLNRQIQSMVQSALRHLPSPGTYSKVAETGDGAILLFESPQDAHSFAEQLHLHAERYNRSRTEESAKRRFRVGISTGEVTREDETGGGDGKSNEQESRRYAGIAISNAVRLETAAEPGETVIDLPTFAILPEQDRRSYGDETVVPGKRSEVFRVRRYKVSPVSTLSPAKKKHISGRWLIVLGTVAAPVVAAVGIWLHYTERTAQHPRPDDPSTPVLQRVQAKPNSVHQGERVTVTVELDRPAPRGGVSINLSSTDPAILTLDGNALVQQGETVGTNYSRAVAVPTYPSPVQIVAAYNNETRRADVNVVAGEQSAPPSRRPSPIQTPASRGTPLPIPKPTAAVPNAPPTRAETAPQPKPAPLNAELLSRLEDAQARLTAENAFWFNVKKTLPPNGSLRPEITSQIYAAESTSQRCTRDRQEQDASSLSSCIDSLNDHLNQMRIQH